MTETGSTNMSETDKHARQTIVRAFYDAQSRRPYLPDAALVQAATPRGGEWTVVADAEKMRHQIMWNGVRVAGVDPDGSLGRWTSADIASALGAAPTMDCALRVIIVLAENGEHLDLIRRLAVAVVAHIERPAPRLPDQEEPEEAEDPEEGDF
ncbi:MAG: hypothetical protein KGL39_30350 [Patescibacteria group bacterium]|nr:hypothetical protein [Patescibacteria group bacterium]